MDPRFVSVLDTRNEGRVDALYGLLKVDPMILENLDAVPFIDTPLHVASATNNLEIVMELLILKPSLGNKLNADGHSPLHIAVEKDHTEVALELIKCDPDLVRVRGRGGITPLHLVAKKGGVDLLTEFIRACPESIQYVNVKGETALHIMVLNHRNDELEVLTGWLKRIRSIDAGASVLNRCDREGNTALHLAASQNNEKAAEQLVRCMSMHVNVVNKSGKTALDIILDHGDQMNQAAKEILEKAGVKKADSLSKVGSGSSLLRKKIGFKEYLKMHMEQYRSQLSDGTRNSLLVISGLVIQSTYQYAIQPPEKPEDEDDVTAKVIIMMVLSFCNSVGFYAAVAFAYLLLPEGRSYQTWYGHCIIPLLCSFAYSVYVHGHGFPGAVGSVYMIVFGMMHFIIIFYGGLVLRRVYRAWKQNKLHRVPKVRKELNVQVFKSRDHGISVV